MQMAKKRVPETRYPHNLERSYAKRIIKMVDALGDVVLTEFDKQPELFNDASISEQIKAMVNKIKGLSLGIFNEKDVAKVASSHVRAVSSASKSNVNSQVAVSGVNPIETETWIKDYTNVKVAENVSYITNIKDEYTQKIEQTIYRGVTEGKSNAEMKEELVQQTGMAENKAKFVARDQTGTLLGQMNAERHSRAGIEAFIWKDSDDGAVRATHAERDGRLYYYGDSPLLPGTEYGCRCIAKPAFEEDIEKAEANGTAVRGNNEQEPTPKKEPKQKAEVKKIDFIPLEEDNLGDIERIGQVIDRAKDVVNSYKNDTGIDVMELYANKQFADKQNRYDDERSKFVKYMMNSLGYDKNPTRITENDNLDTLYRGVADAKYGSITAQDQVDNFLNGPFDISGAFSSAHGRGMYFGYSKQTAKKYASEGENGAVIEVFLTKDSKILDQDLLSSEISAAKKIKDDVYAKFGKDADYYYFSFGKTSLMDKQYETFAMLRGYDGIIANKMNGVYLSVFNRTALGVIE